MPPSRRRANSGYRAMMRGGVSVDVVLQGGASLPQYQTPGSAGMDLKSIVDITLQPGDRKLVNTGVFLALPDGFEGQVRPRSGLALKNGVTVLNAPGTIDSDYRGEVGVILANLGSQPFDVKTGDRIAQLVIAPVISVDLVVVESLDETSRAGGGFGSTGR